MNPSSRRRALVFALLLALGVVAVPVPAGAAGGTLSLSPATLPFGSQRVGTSSVIKTITVTNTHGSNTVEITGVSLVGSNPNDFVLRTTCVGAVVGSGQQIPQTLQPAQSCTIDVKFVPVEVDGRTAEVRIQNDGAEPDKRASVSGSGTVGYYLGGLFGETQAFGDAIDKGDATAIDLNAPIIDMATTQTNGEGYWLLGLDGGVFAYGDAGFYGSTGSLKLNAPVIGMAPAPLSETSMGRGYWFVAFDGGVFAYGEDAPFLGSMGGQPLNQPVVGMAATPTGRGYWLVAADGGIFAFGDAGFFGSMGGQPINEPIVGMAATPTGKGYWLVALDGGIFSFGDAPFKGSTGGIPLNADIVDMWPSPSGNGYWIASNDGGVFNFGDAAFRGSLGGNTVDTAIAIAGTAPPLSPQSERARTSF